MVTTSKLTLDNFLALPEQKPALEFVDGEVIQKPLPTVTHSILQGAFIFLLRTELLKRGFHILPELRHVFGDPSRSYVPDLSIVASGRLQVDSSGEVLDDFYIVPDIAIEILSPHQGVGRTLEKLSFYVANGVKLGIFVDPDRKQAIVVRQGEQPKAVSEHLSFAPVLDDVELNLADLFAQLRVE